ncbi:hypothetical protein LJR202_000275 [Brevundimonas sp. LjRoot202]
MIHIWQDFRELRPTKLVGMSAQQITWAEIEAFDAATFAGLSAWEKRLIRRLDDAFEAARPGNAPKKPASIADTRAALRAQIAARTAKAQAKGGQPSPT